MRLTVTQLRRIIKEEVARATQLSEARVIPAGTLFDYLRGMDAFSEAVDQYGAVQTIDNYGKRGIKPGEVFARVEGNGAFAEVAGHPEGLVLRTKRGRGRAKEAVYNDASPGDVDDFLIATLETFE